MPIDILMPALSPTMEEGKLSKWLKKEGDAVKSGDIIAEIETDKATMEFEAVDEGTFAKILIPEGTENVKVNTPIALLAGEGEDAGTVSAAAPKAAKRGNGDASDAPPRTRRTRTRSARPTRNPRRPPGPFQRRRAVRRRPIPICRLAPRWSTCRCARRCATPWPKRCAATPTCSSWARKSPNIRAPTR